jgi:hypothetical protein
MKLTRASILAGMAKKAHNETRKPENRARIRSAVAKLREHRRRP